MEQVTVKKSKKVVKSVVIPKMVRISLWDERANGTKLIDFVLNVLNQVSCKVEQDSWIDSDNNSKNKKTLTIFCTDSTYYQVVLINQELHSFYTEYSIQEIPYKGLPSRITELIDKTTLLSYTVENCYYDNRGYYHLQIDKDLINSRSLINLIKQLDGNLFTLTIKDNKFVFLFY